MKFCIKHKDGIAYCVCEHEPCAILQEIIELSKTGIALPCGAINPDCDNCTDEIMEYGKKCMQKKLVDIQKLVKKALTWQE